MNNEANDKLVRCQLCDKEFQTDHQSRIYCDDCRYNRPAKSLLIVRNAVCPSCSKTFQTSQWNRQYCDECKYGYEHLATFCVVCGGTKKLRKHHIVATKKGGNEHRDNKATLCTSCHRAVHAMRLHQDITVTDEGWEMFKLLVEKCETRMLGGFKRAW